MQTIYIYIFRTEPCTRTQDSIGGEKGKEECGGGEGGGGGEGAANKNGSNCQQL